MTTHRITKYNYQFHGGPEGYQNSRCILRLGKDDGTSPVYIHFVPTGMSIPEDTQYESGFIRMYMPEIAIPWVLDMLRSEDPINIYRVGTVTRLFTGNEPVGEDDLD
jgi:hypothetical protein